MLKNSENNGTEEIGLVTPTPGLYGLRIPFDMYTDSTKGCITAIIHFEYLEPNTHFKLPKLNLFHD